MASGRNVSALHRFNTAYQLHCPCIKFSAIDLGMKRRQYLPLETHCYTCIVLVNIQQDSSNH